MSNEPKIMNVVLIWDVACVAVEEQAAINAVNEFVRSGEEPASHRKALTLKVSPLHKLLQDRKPIVAADVSDKDFMRFKGKTAQEIYDLLNKKAQP